MPSKSDKQRRFMGAKLAQQRKTGHNSTGMSEGQLSDFARGPHGSLEDITAMEELEKPSSITLDGFLYRKGESGTHDRLEKLASWECRDIKSYGDSRVEVDYYGPDTDYRAEEIDMAQYGRDYEPIPLRDYFKSEDKQFERGFRNREQDEYDSTPTPGYIRGRAERSSTAYGARALRESDRDICDGECNRDFESQRRFARASTEKSEEYAVDVSGIDTKSGKKFR